VRSKKRKIDTETNEVEEDGRITHSWATTLITKDRQEADSERSHFTILQSTKEKQADEIEDKCITRSRATTISRKDYREVVSESSQSTRLRSKKQKLDTTFGDIEEDRRVTRTRAATISTNDIHVLDFKRAAEVTPTSLPNSFRNTASALKTEISSRPTTRSQVVSATTITSPVRVRPLLEKWKGPALIAQVDTQHAYHSLFLGDTDFSTETEDSVNTEQMDSAMEFLDHLPDDNVMYCLSAAELISDYDNLSKQNEMIEKVNFGNTIESALNVIQRKLKELEQYEVVEDTDVVEDIREFKRSVKALAALRESECLVRFREMEQDKEFHMRQLSLGVQAGVTPIQLEVSEMCDRKIWWVVEKEWLKGSERPCKFGAKCALCLRKDKAKISNKSNESITAGVLKMPRIFAFNPDDHEELKNNSKTPTKCNKARRYNIRSIEMQKKASLTRLELQRLQASLSFVDHYNRTGKYFLPGNG
jgi:hypothetical protein